MLAKVVLICFLVAVASQPAPQVPDDDDLPVYTEKVVPNRPTSAPAKAFSASTRFQSKKLRPTSKATLYKSKYDVEPSVELKTHYEAPKPATKPVPKKVPRRTRAHPQKPRGPLRGEHAAPQPTYASVPREVHEYGPPQDTYRSYAAAPVSEYARPPVQDYVPPPPHRDDPATGYEINAYESKPQPYSFGYEVKDEHGSSQNRQEEDDGYGNKKGSYGYTDGYGVYRQVEYVADKHGFRATIKTNEPGTDNQDPADVHIQSDAVQHISQPHY